MTETTPFANGKCLCGAVTFSVKNKPMRMAQCHCEDCRRASGTGHMSLAFFNEDDVKIDGAESEFTVTTDSGNQYSRSFCTTCGSRLFGRNSGRLGVISVAIGVFNDTEWFKPDAIVYKAAQPTWDKMDDDVMAFDAMPPA